MKRARGVRRKRSGDLEVRGLLAERQNSGRYADRNLDMTRFKRRSIDPSKLRVKRAASGDGLAAGAIGLVLNGRIFFCFYGLCSRAHFILLCGS
jgi:hypothetical protein